MQSAFDQSPFQYKMDWGTRGVEEAAKRHDIVVIVDILSFSTTVTAAVTNGAIIYPFSKAENPEPLAHAVGAEIILGRKEAKTLGKPSQSPTSFTESFKKNRYVLSTINGGACVKASGSAAAVLIGCFLNASAVAKAAIQLQEEKQANVTIVACGERWSGEQRELRPSVEDYLGAGIILSMFKGAKSIEADVCIAAYENSKKNLKKIIWDCSSGRELRRLGVSEDVTFSSNIDLIQTVPILASDDFGYTYFKIY